MLIVTPITVVYRLAGLSFNLLAVLSSLFIFFLIFSVIYLIVRAGSAVQ